jgi:hypothetical protein
VALFKDKSAPSRRQPVLIPVQDGGACVFGADGQTGALDGQMGARRQADQINGVRKAASLIEIIDAPNEPSFDVPLCPEVLYVKVTDSQRLGRFETAGAHLRPLLDPAVESRAQKKEWVGRHGGVLALEIVMDQRGVPGEPCFIAARGFDDVHDGRAHFRAKRAR